MQDKLKELSPTFEIVTASLPEVVFVPDQEPDAEQEVALVVDQVRVVVLVKRTDVGSADKFTDGAGVNGATGALPPPPPPQEAIQKITKVTDKIFLIKFNLIQFNYKIMP